MRQSKYLAGPITRTRKSQKKYNYYKKTAKPVDGCVFCDPREMLDPIDRGNFCVIGNRFMYDTWDGCQVTDHLMVIPKRHVHSVKDLTQDEQLEYLTLLSEYEGNGYSIYSRAMNAATRTVDHLHTHLIQFDPAPIKAMVYLTKPHVMLFKK